jgi:hypothetical protein
MDFSDQATTQENRLPHVVRPPVFVVVITPASKVVCAPALIPTTWHVIRWKYELECRSTA